MIGFILAAGLGTRLKPMTDTMPKAMVQVDGHPLLWHAIKRLREAGASRIVVNVHHFAEQIIDYVGSNDFGIRVDISDEREMLLDTGGAIRHARELLRGDEPILIHNVDIFSTADLGALVEAHTRDVNLATLLCNERQSTRHLLFSEGDMRLRAWENTATGERKPKGIKDEEMEGLMPLSFAGIHVVSQRMLDLMEGCQEKFSVIDFYLDVCGSERVVGSRQEEIRILDVGKIGVIGEAEEFVRGL